MSTKNEPSPQEPDEHGVREDRNSSEPNAFRVEDENDLEEKDLRTHYLFGEGKMKSTSAPGMEGQGMGGGQFGRNNLTPAGNDQDNPPQNAGEDNAYFARRQPAEEHPEDSNFTAAEQTGGPGKEQPNIPGPNELPDQQKVGENEDEKAPHPQQPYREGTSDNDGNSAG